jgi:putative spermidine/putrescine transport system ATP-binding protein
MSLKVVNLSKRFEDRWVLRDVSFDVPNGEIFGIVGPSGSGKSTLLQTIAGMIKPNGGEISHDGASPVLYSANHADRGSLWTRLFGKPKASSAEESLRAMIARIEGARGVLLVDDPFSGMDHDAREKAETAIRSARDRGLSIVVATSDFEQAMAICDRASVLATTELKQTGTPRDLYDKPGSRAVATATGRCNLFAARRLSSSKADIPEFHTIDGGHRLFARHVERGSLGAINQNVTLGIRPEHISISFGASFPEDNLLRATITGVRFLGPTTLLDLDSDGLRLQALVLRLVGLNIGDECVLGLPIDNVHIFRD